ncbi:DUF6462 family protein [Butyrivibrio sp.]|jgi:hypothetical protein|uniref:DUF6462 family protein n=1 Tax=Butyrivibrio sp. TaxID=28121 RepID=UPI0025BDC594|nr:DUF6462 family protein [Butyrivibrio sp.]
MGRTAEIMLIDRKYVRYDSGAELYGMCQKSFEKLAKDAKARHKVGKMVLVDIHIVDRYIETCRLIED